MFVGVSVGERRGVQKDTLVNIRSSGAFCVNVVSEPLLEAMNKTSAEVQPEVDEFELSGSLRRKCRHRSWVSALQFSNASYFKR